MPKILLTPAVIKHDLICPEPKRRIELCDTEVPGLYVECRATSPGQGTYYLRSKDSNKKTCHKHIGRTNEITLSAARERAKSLKAENSTNRVKGTSDISFKTFALEHYLPMKKGMKRSYKDDAGKLDQKIIPFFGDTPLNEVSRAQIIQFISKLRDEHGLAGATCNRFIAILHHMFVLAEDLDLLTNKNPATRIKRYKEEQRSRKLTSAEQQRLLQALETDKNRTVCLLIKLLMLTGCRLSEWQKATWAMIDRERRILTIPASNSKSGKIRTVPLSSTVIELLDELAQLPWVEGKDHLFINRHTGRVYTHVYKAWNRIRKTAELPDLRIHDLRHHYASILVNSGRSLYEVQLLLGHTTPRMTQRYAHLNNATLFEATEAASVFLGANRESTSKK